MPRKIVPRTNWQLKSMVRWNDTGCYPKALVQDIAREFDIRGAKRRRELKERLEMSGTIYLAAKHNSRAPRQSEVTATFRTMKQRADELHDLLKNMDDRSWSFYWKAEQALEQSFRWKGDNRLVDIGFAERYLEDEAAIQAAPAGTAISETMGRKHLFAALQYLSLVAKEAEAAAAREKPQPRLLNVAMQTWIGQMVEFWEYELGRRFTVNYLYSSDRHPAATSPAGAFLERCLEPMDPEAVPLLVGQLRRFQKTRKSPSPKRHRISVRFLQTT